MSLLLRVSVADVEALEAAIASGRLPVSAGDLFGEGGRIDLSAGYECRECVGMWEQAGSSPPVEWA